MSNRQDDPLALMETIERADLAAELENAGLGLDDLPEWQRLCTAIEHQQSREREQAAEIERLRARVARLRGMVKDAFFDGLHTDTSTGYGWSISKTKPALDREAKE